MRKLVAMTVACLAVVSLAACGSSTKKASTSKDTTPTTAKAVAGAAVASDLLKYCDYSKAAQDAGSAATAAGGDLKSQLSNVKANLDAYANAAPAEIKADVNLTVDKFLKPFIAALEKANYDFTKADLSSLAGLATNADVQAANQRIAAYYAAHCNK